MPVVEIPETLPKCDRRAGLWLHSDDLVPEVGPLCHLKPISIAVLPHEQCHDFPLSVRSTEAANASLTDGLARAATHFACPAELIRGDDPAASLKAWALTHGLAEVVAFAPTVGPIGDLLPMVRKHLASAGIALTLVRRTSDALAFQLATSGFFPSLGKDESPPQQTKQPFSGSMTPAQISTIIRLAWEDRTTFEEIRKRTGVAEHEVIDIMRRELKPSSFRLWRKRVSGRVTKHRKLLKQRISGPRERDGVKSGKDFFKGKDWSLTALPLGSREIPAGARTIARESVRFEF
jgi:uncharacterized protein (TIGR03643 family)